MKRAGVGVCAVVVGATLGLCVYRAGVYTPAPGVDSAAPVSTARPAAPSMEPSSHEAPRGANSAAGGSSRIAHEDSGEERPEFPGEAAYMRWQQRLSEDGTVPHDAMMTAFRQREAMIAAQGENGIADGGISPIRWTWIGPGNIGGRIRSVLVHPDNSNLMWVGSVSGGIWKSTNAGAWFEPVNDFLPNLAITTMIFDPGDADVMYAGTGEGGFFVNQDGSSNTAAVRGAGVFKSVDGGATWARLESTSGPEWYQVCRLAADPSDGQTLLAATGSGIFRSTDGGATWSQRTATRTLDVDFHPTDGTLAIAGRDNGLAQYSTDGGLTWTNASGLTGTRVELAYAPSNPSIVYASVSRSGRLNTYRSTDGGRTFAARAGGFSTLALYDDALWVSPTNENFVVVGGLEVWRSTNGASSFEQISQWYLAPQSPHADTHIVMHHPAFDGTTNKTVYVGNDGGLYRTDDITTVTVDRGWFVMNNNLGITQFYGAANGPLSDIVVAGAQDNGTSRFTGDPQGWESIFGGDGTFAAADPTDGDVFYGGSQRLNLFRTDDGGDNTVSIVGGSNDILDRGSSRCNFIPYFCLDPNNPNRMLAAGRQLWRTNNVKAGRPDWFAIKPLADGCTFDPDGDEHEHLHGEDGAGQDHYNDNNPCNISTIAVAPGNSDVIWVGHNRGDLFKTTNGTAGNPAWTQMDLNDPLLPNRWVSSIAISPFDANRVYVTFMGYEADNVWRTTDGGATWQRITGSGTGTLPSAPATWIVHHRTKPGWLYVATDVGIFASEDDGAAWSTSNDGPSAVTLDQLFWKDDCTLFAVTHGRGIFKADVCGLCEGIDRVKLRCRAGTFRLKATAVTTLPEGTALTLNRDGAESVETAVNARGKAKGSFVGVAPGDHTVCVKECATKCETTSCQ